MMQSSQFTMPVRVYYEDTDAGGVVYYANYLRFFERCRSEWVRSFGCDQRQLAEAHDLAFVVRRASIEYLRPARLDDLLTIGLTVEHFGRAQITVAQCALREADGILLASGTVQLAAISASAFKPKTIPGWMRQQLESYP